MLSFSASGRLGRIDRLNSERLMLRLSVACDRLVDGPSGKWTKTEWLSGICFDADTCARLAKQCSIGDRIQLSGRIEPRKRVIGETKVHEHSFIIETAHVIEPAKASVKERAA